MTEPNTKPAIEYLVNGGRRVNLLIPFKAKKPNNEEIQVTAVDIGPVEIDHVMLFNEGRYENSLALLASMCGIPVPVLRKIKYPDADRVLGAFMDMLPASIRLQIEAGQIPMPKGMAEAQQQQPAGGTSDLADGVQPRPDDDESGPGFDMGR